MNTDLGGTQVLFVTGLPYTMVQRWQFYSWLIENTEIDPERCKEIALTGEALPYLLFANRKCGPKEQWPEQLESMEVKIHTDFFAYTDAPMEAVYAVGRSSEQQNSSSLAKRVKAFRVWWEEQGYGYMGLIEAREILRGHELTYIASIRVCNEKDRSAFTETMAAFGLTGLEFIDIQSPWVD